MPLAHIFKPGRAENLFYAWFSAMHSRLDLAFVVAPSRSEQHCLQTAEAVRERIAEIEALANCYDPRSELARYNSGLLTLSALSPELRQILALADHWTRQTQGLFNPRFPTSSSSSCSAIQSPSSSPSSPGINLSGFLKGYALDAIRPIILAAEIPSALVSFGGSSILAIGSQPGRTDGWQVSNADGETFLLCNECLTTSGNDSPQRRHIINPLTEEVAEGQKIVSVLTKTATEGEARSIEAFLKMLFPSPPSLTNCKSENLLDVNQNIDLN